MQKDFDNWNKDKKSLHGARGRPFYHEREVWWCALGVNVGFEQDGTGKNFDRPIVILRGFNREVCFGVALTGKKRVGKYYLPLGRIQGREVSAILSQVRLIDTKRLIRKIKTLDEERFKKLTRAVQKILFS